MFTFFLISENTSNSEICNSELCYSLCIIWEGLECVPEAFIIVRCVRVVFLRRRDYEMNKMRRSCNEFVQVEGGVNVLVGRTLIERQQ